MMILRGALLLGLGIAPGLAAQTPTVPLAGSDSAQVTAFVSSLAFHPGVDVELARFKEGRLAPDYRLEFANVARGRVAEAVAGRLEEMVREGCSSEVEVEFPGRGFIGRPGATGSEEDFENSVVLTLSSDCYETDVGPEELLRIYASRDVRMAAQSRMEDVYEQDGLTCYAVGGVPLLLGATRSCNDVRRHAGDGLALEHSQTVWSEAEGHQPVFFKESVKAAIRLDDGSIGLVHVTLTRSTGLGRLEKRLGRGRIEESLRGQMEVLAEWLASGRGATLGLGAPVVPGR